MILCDIHSDAILVEPMENWTSGKVSKANKKLMEQLKGANIIPKKHILDNKGSNDFLQHIKQAGIVYKKVLPHMHKHNTTKKATRTFKNHFIVISASIDKRFPMHLWD